MKRLINGMFSSMPDAAFIAQILDAESADIESDVETDAKDKPEEPGPPDVGGDDWLPS
jgi:hypothetical protein